MNFLKKPTLIYQLKITLKGIRPPIWRRIQICNDNTLGDLHYAIQGSMGWSDSHLHCFEIVGTEYGSVLDEDPNVKDETRFKLSKLIPIEKFKFNYLYDFGDSWQHEILLEKILEPDPKIKYPICIKAKRACPPDDCGGVWGYAEFLEAIQDPKNPEHEELLEWVGGFFDPEAVDLDEINAHLHSKYLRNPF